MKCNYCKSKIKRFFKFRQNSTCQFVTSQKGNFKNEKKFELIVYVCEKCWLVQTKQVTDKKVFFNDKYPYYSSISKTWLRHCEIFVKNVIKKFKLSKFSNVIEIASNDGYLLQYFKKRKFHVLV